MRFKIDGVSLLEYCKRRNLNYVKTLSMIKDVLNIENERRPPKDLNRHRERVRIHNRKLAGYGDEIATLSKEEFRKRRAREKGTVFVGKYNLSYVCRKLNLDFDYVYFRCVKSSNSIRPEEYLRSLGYDLTEFME